MHIRRDEKPSALIEFHQGKIYRTTREMSSVDKLLEDMESLSLIEIKFFFA